MLDIQAAVMIVWDEQGMTIGGPPVASGVPIDGSSWDLYASGTTLTYVPHGGIASAPTSLRVDMAKFLEDGLGRGLLQATWWVASIETAAIVYQGTGGFSLDDYAVTFRAK